MDSIGEGVPASNLVTIQTSPHSVPSPPSRLGEVTVLAHYLQRQGVFAALQEQVRFARRRFGHYDVIDFVAVLFGYAVSAERTLEAFYQRLQPWASANVRALRTRPAACTFDPLALFGRLDPGTRRSPALLVPFRSGTPAGRRGTGRRAVGSSWHALVHL
jgi:hypothetical protein